MLRGHSPQQVGGVPRPCESDETVVVEMTPPLSLFGTGSGLTLSETTSETLAAACGGPAGGGGGGSGGACGDGAVSPTLLALCAASKARRPLASSVRSSTAPPTHAGGTMKKTVSFPRDEGQLNTMCPITPPTHANRFGQFGSLFPNQDFRGGGGGGGGRCQPEPFNLDDCALGADGSPSSQRNAVGVERRERGVSLGVVVLAFFIVALYSMAVLADTPDTADVNPLAGGGADGADDATLVAAAAAAAESRRAPSSRRSTSRGHRRRGTIEVTAEIHAECGSSAGQETAEMRHGRDLHSDGKSTDAAVRDDGSGDAAALGSGIGEMEAYRTIVCHTKGVLLDAGLRVTYRRATSPAALSGVRPGMRLTHVGGQTVSGVAEAATALRARHADEKVVLIFSSAP